MFIGLIDKDIQLFEKWYIKILSTVKITFRKLY